MRLLVHLCNQRFATYHIDHMWPMSEKIKKLIPTNKLIIQDTAIEDFGWPKGSKSLSKQTTKPKQESVSRP